MTLTDPLCHKFSKAAKKPDIVSKKERAFRIFSDLLSFFVYPDGFFEPSGSIQFVKKGYVRFNENHHPALKISAVADNEIRKAGFISHLTQLHQAAGHAVIVCGIERAHKL